MFNRHNSNPESALLDVYAILIGDFGLSHDEIMRMPIDAVNVFFEHWSMINKRRNKKK